MVMIGTVLIVVENRPALMDTRIWPIALALRKFGLNICVISPKRDNDKADTRDQEDAHREGIHLYTYHLPQFTGGWVAYLFEYALSLWHTWWLSLRVLREHGFDTIHVANPPDIFFLLGWFYHLLGKHFIFDQHDLSPELFKAKFGKHHWVLYSVLLWMEKRSKGIATLVITTNESQRKLTIKRDGCDPEKVMVVRNGPDLERLVRVPAEPALKGGRPFFLVYLGAMEVQDGVENTLHALYELVHIYGRQDISLALLGGGSELSNLKRLAQGLELEAYVTFTGWIDGAREIARYLCTADIGLCPDPRNGLNEFSTTVKSMEYMAMGLPLVSFDLEETRYTAHGAALYATPNSVQDFASQIIHLLDDPELRNCMGRYARTRVEECLSWDHCKQQLRLAYAKIFSQLI